MNNIKIKVNGVAISLENSPVINDTSLEDMSALLSKENDNIEKMIKATALLSDIKTVESFGYVSTESVGESIKNAAVAAWKVIKEFFIKLGKFIADVVANGALKTRASALLKKVEATDEANINFGVVVTQGRLSKQAARHITIADVTRYVSCFINSVKSEDIIYDKSIVHSMSSEEVKTNLDKATSKLYNAIDEFMEAVHGGMVDFSSNSPIVPLHEIGLDSKSKIIEFLKGVCAGSDVLTTKSKEIRSVVNSALYIAEHGTGIDLNNPADVAYRKGVTMLGKGVSQLIKSVRLFQNMWIVSISAALKNQIK